MERVSACCSVTGPKVLVCSSISYSLALSFTPVASSLHLNTGEVFRRSGCFS